MSENPTAPQPVLRLTIDLPGVYTADLEDALIYESEWTEDESEALINALQISHACGLRLMVSGEKDADMVTVKGEVVEARLMEPRDG